MKEQQIPTMSPEYARQIANYSAFCKRELNASELADVASIAAELETVSAGLVIAARAGLSHIVHQELDNVLSLNAQLQRAVLVRGWGAMRGVA